LGRGRGGRGAAVAAPPASPAAAELSPAEDAARKAARAARFNATAAASQQQQGPPAAGRGRGSGTTGMGNRPAYIRPASSPAMGRVGGPWAAAPAAPPSRGGGTASAAMEEEAAEDYDADGAEAGEEDMGDEPAAAPAAYQPPARRAPPAASPAPSASSTPLRWVPCCPCRVRRIRDQACALSMFWAASACASWACFLCCLCPPPGTAACLLPACRCVSVFLSGGRLLAAVHCGAPGFCKGFCEGTPVLAGCRSAESRVETG
jgi:hypothetical protein